jgi:hypothetical protein
LSALAEPHVRALIFLKWYILWLQDLLIYVISDLRKVPNNRFKEIAPLKQELLDIRLEQRAVHPRSFLDFIITLLINIIAVVVYLGFFFVYHGHHVGRVCFVS